MEDTFNDASQNSNSAIDLKHYFAKLLSNYYWIILALIISLFGAFLYLRYSVPKYQISGYILVGGAELESSTGNILANAGLVSQADSKGSAVNNEMFILQSHQINGVVVDSLQLGVNITRSGSFKDQAIFKDSLPVDIIVNRDEINTTSPLYQLDLKENTYTLHNKKTAFQSLYGKSIVVNGDTVIVSKKHGKSVASSTYSLQFMSRLATVKKYLSRLTIGPVKNGGVGLLKISVVDEMPIRANQYIQVLIRSYNLSYLDYKNQAIRRALVFLGERLKTVSSELSQQENEVRDFKANNKVYDISSSATELLANLSSLDAQRSTNNYQEELLSLVEGSMKKTSGNEEVVASANGLQDAVLISQVNAYNDLVFRKQLIESSGTEDDPRLGPLDEQLNNVKSSILKNIGNIKKQFKTGQSYVTNQESKFTNKFQALPEKEKQFVELSRKLSIKESQYVFLLQKKEETEIQLVSADGDRSRKVDDILNDGVVSPVALKVFGIATLLGLLLPLLVIFLVVFFNQKIETKKEIESGTTVPILGELGLSTSVEPIVISANNRSMIAEQLRAIRTNLSFMVGENEQKVLIVTSTMSGEGKSFLSLNLGNSLAISNKKVAILELDLRKPMLSRNLNITNKVGISTYLIKKDILPQDIIQPIANYPNLYLINSGPIPPNPGELIISPKMGELISFLKQNFDYVILDLPPIGLVADALSLTKYADLSLFVMRPNYSLRSSLSLLNSLQKDNKFPKLSVIVNGIDPAKGYGYGYGYGYGSGYYIEDEATNQNFFKKIINNITKRT